MSRHERRRKSAQYYQRSRGGRLKHAARTARWRRRRRSLGQAGVGEIDKVTHQGCPHEPADASLLACETPSACEAQEPTIDADSANDTAAASAATVGLAVLVCRRCAYPLPPHVRQGWLCASRVRWRGHHDHPT
jgi:hypothetical protein